MHLVFGGRTRDTPNWLYDFSRNQNLNLLLMEFSGGIEGFFCIDGGRSSRVGQGTK